MLFWQSIRPVQKIHCFPCSSSLFLTQLSPLQRQMSASHGRARMASLDTVSEDNTGAPDFDVVAHYEALLLRDDVRNNISPELV